MNSKRQPQKEASFSAEKEPRAFSALQVPLSRIHLVSFADSRLKGSRRRFRMQATEFGFQSVTIHSEKTLEKSFRQKHLARLSGEVRGFGYWVWKPHVILSRLKQLPQGHLLVYADVGFHIRSEGMRWFSQYIGALEHSTADFLVFQSSIPYDRPYWDGRWVPHLPDSHWTKGDLLDHLGMRDHPEVKEPTIGSGLIFIRNTEQSRQFVENWQRVVADLHLVDDSPSMSPNLEGFVENRHDQAALSLMLKRGDISKITFNAFDYWFPLPGGVYWKSDWSALEESPFWARRDLRERPEGNAAQRVADHIYRSFRRLHYS